MDILTLADEMYVCVRSRGWHTATDTPGPGSPHPVRDSP
jgi:hypothetical protein